MFPFVSPQDADSDTTDVDSDKTEVDPSVHASKDIHYWVIPDSCKRIRLVRWPFLIYYTLFC